MFINEYINIGRQSCWKKLYSISNCRYFPGDKKYIKIKTKSKIIKTNIIVPSVYRINFGIYILFNKKSFKDYHGFILVFDLSNENSLNSIAGLFTRYEENIFLDSPLVLFGNKCDLSSKIKDPEDFAQKYNLKYFETSAINNINVKEGFKELVIDILKKYGNKFDKPMELKKNKKKKDMMRISIIKLLISIIMMKIMKIQKNNF